MDKPVFDFLNRQQVYVEGVKNWQGRDFNRYLKLLADAIRDYLNKAGVKLLSDLPKAKFTALLKRINRRMSEIFDGFGSDFMTTLKQFTFIDTRMQKSAWAIVKPTVDVTGPAPSSIWSRAKDRIVPAFGRKVAEQAADLASIAKEKVRSRINTGFADNETTADVADAVTNLNARSFSSTLQQVGNAARGFISTAFQHATNTVSDVLGAIAYDCYQWCSVIDSKTSTVCRERDGTVYRQGEGPVPPAHNNCRSRTIPCDCGEQPKVPPFFSWLLTQSKDFISDAFGDSVGKKFANGSLRQGDVGDFKDYPPLSLDDFELKAPLLTK